MAKVKLVSDKDNLRWLSLWEDCKVCIGNDLVFIKLCDRGTYANVIMRYEWHIMEFNYMYQSNELVVVSNDWSSISYRYSLDFSQVKKCVVKILSFCERYGKDIVYLVLDGSTHYVSYEEKAKGGYLVDICCSGLNKVSGLLKLPCSVDNIQNILNIIYSICSRSYNGYFSNDTLIYLERVVRDSHLVIGTKDLVKGKTYLLLNRGRIGISSSGMFNEFLPFKTVVYFSKVIDISKEKSAYLKNGYKNPCIKVKVQGSYIRKDRKGYYKEIPTVKYLYIADEKYRKGDYSRSEFVEINSFYKVLKYWLQNIS